MRFSSEFSNIHLERKTIVHAVVFLALLICVTLCLGCSAFAQNSEPKVSSSSASKTGVLLMAHGGGKDWNNKVQTVAAEVDKQMPTEVALGMADHTTLQAAVDKLTARGVTEIVAVPLFVSSHSSVIESTKYLLGVRPDAPKELADFEMDDRAHMSNTDAASSTSAQTKSANNSASPTSAKKQEIAKPVISSVPIRISSALDHHRLVAQILADRAAAIAHDPSRDVVIIVAHGPNEDQENALWLSDMNALVAEMSTQPKYARIEYATLRDDADDTVRDQATAQLRQSAQSADDAGYHVLIVPLLLSYGGIESGLRQRLDGVEHTLSPQGLLPDPRIAQWVLESAQSSQTSPLRN